MNMRFTAVERSLNQAEFRWKGLKLLRHSAVLGIFVCLCCLALGLAIQRGLVSSLNVAISAWGILAIGGLLAWCVLLVRILVGRVERNWLASALERIDRRWLDRLNTLLFLEPRRNDPKAESFARRIAQQAQAIAAEPARESPFSAKVSVLWALAFILTLGTTVSFYYVTKPWSRLVLAHHGGSSVASNKSFELALPTNNIENSALWGEVRITDPGSDLQVTKVDVVPLQIEAAANQGLSKVDWLSAVNGGQEVAHALSPPTEPRYAVYHPSIFLDELHLADWDVMTYYAKATTDKKDVFASQVYFLEVRPFREDILNLPGGTGGQAYGTLNELSQLIGRQQQVIRHTYQALQAPQAGEASGENNQKLAETERDLSGSAQHLYAKLAARMENQPIGEALDNLAKAQTSLAEAGTLLTTQPLDQAPGPERRALAELVAARKMFQKAVSQNPDAFRNSDEPPSTPDSAQRLRQMAEFSNEAKVAQEFVQKTLEQQRNLQQQAYSAASPGEYGRLADTENQLRQQLQDFRSQHPQAFKGLEAAAGRAAGAMSGAADSLQQAKPEAPAATQSATRALEQFSQAMQRQSTEQQLADTYRLNQMLEHQARTFDQRTKPESNVSDQQLQQTARDAREALKQMAKAAEQEPTRNAFGRPLRDALAGQNQVDLDAKLRQVEQAQDEAEKQQSAASARDKLKDVSKAFAASQPKSLQLAHQHDALKPPAQEGFSQGLSELQSLLQHLQQAHPLSAPEQAKQGQQALANLRDGVHSQFGDDERGQELLNQLDALLKSNSPPDAEGFRNLLAELQRFAQENSVQLAQDQDGPALTNIDPSRLPPAYRGRIQKYFQKLSEK